MENAPKKVLMVGMTDNPGGIEALMLNVLAAVDPNVVRFDFLANTETVAFERQLRDYGAKIYKITARRKSRRTFYRDLRRVFSEHGTEYDAVWENMNTLGNIDYLVYAKRAGIPNRIIHCHNAVNSEGFVRGLLHRANKLRIRKVATHFWSVSDAASIWFYGRDYSTLPHYRVIDNAINLDRFAFDSAARSSVRESLSLPEETLLLGNVGRLHPQKNQTAVIETVAELRGRGVDARAILVGSGEREEELRHTAAALGVTDSVIFFGAVEDDSSLYSAMDVFFFPSLYEGLGIALLEAQANGVPCLISDSVPQEAVWNSNIRALPCESDSAAWADKAQQLADAGRTTEIALVGSRYDLTSWGKTMSSLFRFEEGAE